MSLLRLKTDLTNLKFGNDRPQYGSSGLPYIQTRIPDKPSSPGTFKPVYEGQSTGNLDFPIRGSGKGSVSVGLQTFTLSAQLDAIRIKKFLEDQPRGPLFLRKQLGLQLTNPKMETGNTLFGAGQAAPLPGLLENTRVYDVTGGVLLSQVRAMGSGAHAIRSGLIPFAPFQKYYYAIVNQQNIDGNYIGTSQNRLVNLNALKMTTGVSPFVLSTNVFDLNKVNALGISLNRNLLFQYQGGPNSVYGAGTTTIKRAVDTTVLGVTVKRFASKNAMTYNQIKSQDVNIYNQGTATTNIQNYSEKLTAGDPIILRYNAQLQRAQDRLARNPKNKRLKNQVAFLQNNPPDALNKKTPPVWGDQTIDKRFYVSPGKYQDKMNETYPFVFKNSAAPWEFNDSETDDLVKFVFEAINNDDPSYSLAIFFRAFLNSSITDNHQASLSNFKYMGRGETFYTYQGFERSINFSFRVAAGSKSELRPMYNRLNALISQVYPDYSDQTKIMRAPLIRLTIGDYFYRMPGFLESVNITIDNGTPWEINLDGDLAQLPQVLDVQVSFKPIMDTLPKRTSISNVKDFVTNTNTQNQTSNVVVYADTENPALIANKENFIEPNFSSAAKGSISATEVELRSERILEKSIENQQTAVQSAINEYVQKNTNSITNLLGQKLPAVKIGLGG